MSPESTAAYYLRIARRHEDICRNHAYPRMVVASVSFQRYIDWQHRGDWGHVACGIQTELEALAAAGADFAILATNTMHRVLGGLRSPIPVVPVFDAIAAAAVEEGYRLCGVLGTRFTMSEPFFAEGLRSRGLEAISPTSAEQEAVHRVIYDELIRGVVVPESRRRVFEVAQSLVARGAEVVLLACTELHLLGSGNAWSVPTLDTAACHADLAWRIAMGDAQP